MVLKEDRDVLECLAYLLGSESLKIILKRSIWVRNGIILFLINVGTLIYNNYKFEILKFFTFTIWL